MINIKKRIILPTILLTGALAAGALGFTQVAAQENTRHTPLVQKIAERFNLNPAEVEDVIKEISDERRANMAAEFATNLDELVVNGKLTEAQKQKLLDKHGEMEQKMDEFKNLSREGRKSQMEAWHKELKIWAEENGIQTPFFAKRLH